MEQKIEKILHQPIAIAPYTDTEKLPLIFRGRYQFYDMDINGYHCVLMEPQDEIGLSEIRKQHRKMEQIAGRHCVLYMKNMKSYPREKMIEEGIPFIWEDHQIYMPFLGMLLKQNDTRQINTCGRFSFLTQKLLLTALYEQWRDMTVTMAAKVLQVSKMSVTRCFDEIEALEVPFLRKKGRTRLLTMNGEKKAQWKTLQPFMRQPLIQSFRLEEDISFELPYSGMTALGEYSMIADNSYKTYAILKSQLADSGIREKQKIPMEEFPGCVVQELGYVINYRGGGSVDPLTLCLLMDEEREDPRVGKAIDEMLEEYVW
ncbi:MAG: hypothetical protein LUF35_13910 [Lachnospiraceae bacterium]|nr:hypothetical protein [Lachnospiraceae bacterium]